MPPPAASRARSRRGRARKSPALHVSVFNSMPEPWEAWERDWAELPADVISCVLHKLSLTELLLGGVAEVCRSWRRAAREEPELWRHIDMRYVPTIPPFTSNATRANFMRSALRLSAGQCRTFLGEQLDDNQFMLLAERVPSLKSLYLSRCSRTFNLGFAHGIKKLPLLEELTFDECYVDQEVLELVVQVCRCLKHLTLVRNRHRIQLIKHADDWKAFVDRKAFAIAKMHGLRSLVLVGDNLNNEGLTAIIDSCPHLEYLNIRDCYDVTMDGNLKAKCVRVIMTCDKYFPPSEPFRRQISWLSVFNGDGYDPDDYHDLSLYSYLCDEIDDVDFEEHEKNLNVKSMRRYLS